MEAERVLIVEDEHALGTALCFAVRRVGHLPTLVASGEAALDALPGGGFRVVVLDIGLPGMSGLELLARLRATDPSLPVLVITAHATLDHAIRAQQLGATQYLTKPLDLGRFEQAVAVLAAAATRGASGGGPVAPVAAGSFTLIGSARCMQPVFVAIARACATPVPTLICGPAGSGKSLAAAIIHAHGPQPGRPLHTLECECVHDPAELADWLDGAAGEPGGTVVLDELPALAAESQAWLARRLGEPPPASDAGHRRVLATSREPVAAAVARGRLQPSLADVFSASLVNLPPLRERSGDIPALAAFFLGLHEGEHHLTPPAMAALQNHPWPGNVRELRTVLECAVSLAHGPALFPSHLPPHVAAAAPDPHEPAPTGELTAAIERWLDAQLAGAGTHPPAYHDLLDRVEAAMLRHLLERHDQRLARLATAMGLHRSTLRQKLRRLGLQPTGEPAAGEDGQEA